MRFAATLTLIASAALTPAVAQQRATLAAGTRFETSYVRIDSKHPGPTVLLFGGIHGNEPAGFRAARQIAGWRIERGTLIVVDRANVGGLAANERWIPDLSKLRRDLNRQFPRKKNGQPTGVLATALWELVKKTRPDFVIDLHEGIDFSKVNPKSVGSSVIAAKNARDRAAKMIASVNTTIENSKKRFVPRGPPVLGSLARAANIVFGIPSMIVETTKLDQQLTLRVRQHRILVHRFLTDLQMLSGRPDVLVGTAGSGTKVNVGMYVSVGVGGPGPQRLEKILSAKRGFVVRRLCAADIRSGALAQFDVVVFPGGGASNQARALETAGRTAVRKFVRAGGGYVGICAGAYLAANNYDWSLGILDADVIDRKHWARGRGQVAIEWATPKVRADVLYVNGPLYAPSRDPDIPDFEVIARYRGEVRKNSAPVGVMINTPAVVAGSYGKGVVICSSPHPEQTKGMEKIVRALIRRAAGQ